MFGLSLGAIDGYDWGFEPVAPDPDFGILAFQAIGREGSLGAGRQPIHRHEFAYDRRRCDIRLGNEARLTIAPPRLEVAMQSADGSIGLKISGRMGGISYWTPDMVLRGTSWVTFACPDIEFEGQIREGDETWDVSGIGTLDHPMGRVRRSALSAGMGWWEYNCFLIEDHFGLFEWYIVDRDGAVMLDRVVTNYPDGQLHVGRMTLDYVTWEDRGEVHVPTAWDVTVEADHGTFAYRVAAAGPTWDGTPQKRGQPLPNFVLELDGSFVSGGTRTPVSGRGTGETVISERDPYRDAAQLPW
jgi:hypothetical protein